MDIREFFDIIFIFEVKRLSKDSVKLFRCFSAFRIVTLLTLIFLVLFIGSFVRFRTAEVHATVSFGSRVDLCDIILRLVGCAGVIFLVTHIFS
jgi:hypothetical protein